MPTAGLRRMSHSWPIQARAGQLALSRRLESPSAVTDANSPPPVGACGAGKKEEVVEEEEEEDMDFDLFG